MDIVAGSYTGAVTLFKGSKEGFLPGELIVEQVKRWGLDEIFTDAVPVDFNGDGLYDLLCGGLKGVRMMLNTGTVDKPQFTKKLPVMMTNGLQVSSTKYTKESLESYNSSIIKTGEGYTSDFHAMISYLDYDGDGIKDMLVAPTFYGENNDLILFYKGVKTATLPKFEEPVTLFAAKDGGRSFPGSNPIPFFCDYNNDGKLDMVLGISLNYDKVNNCFNDIKEYEDYASVGFDKKAHDKAYFDEYRALAQSEKFKDMDRNDEALNNEYYAAIDEISKKYVAMEPRVKAQKKVPEYEGRGYILVFYGK